MLNLTSEIHDFLLDNTDLEVDEVYQIFQSNTSPVYAEVRLQHPSGADEYKDVFVEISKNRTKVLRVGDAREEFGDKIEAYNN